MLVPCVCETQHTSSFTTQTLKLLGESKLAKDFEDFCKKKKKTTADPAGRAA